MPCRVREGKHAPQGKEGETCIAQVSNNPMLIRQTNTVGEQTFGELT